MSGKKRFSYDASFKLKVAAYAIEHNNSSKAARTFCVSEKLVRDWYETMDKLEKLPKKKKACRGLSTVHNADEQELLDWIMQHRQNGYVITRAVIRIEAQRSFKDKHFKALSGWCNNFMNRYGLGLRARTKIGQKLPAELDRHAIKLLQADNYHLSCIANMEKTPVYFDLPDSRTVHPTGKKTDCNERSHFTPVLGVCAVAQN